MVTLTEKAAQEVHRILREKAMPPATGLLITLKGGGCSGMTYVLDFSDGNGMVTQRFESKGVPLLVEEPALPYVKGLEIDFVDDLLNRGFKFQNPNATHTCGCGTSFSV